MKIVGIDGCPFDPDDNNESHENAIEQITRAAMNCVDSAVRLLSIAITQKNDQRTISNLRFLTVDFLIDLFTEETGVDRDEIIRIIRKGCEG